MKVLKVELGDNRSYDILIGSGLLERAANHFTGSLFK
jgi:hypothetical protein